ncbi:MAG: peptidoglycan synthetase [Campylobacterota bacterium]
MRISSLIDIVNGELLNSPSISFIYSFKTDCKKVKEGDLFIAKEIDSISLAVQNGAFAVIIDENHPIIDNEIAWIKVEDINLALIQLIRFKLANYDLKSYFTDTLTYDFLRVFSHSSSKKIRFFDDIETFIKNIDNIENSDIIVSTNKELLNKIYPNSLDFNRGSYNFKNLVVHSLFEVSFTHNGTFFSKLRIPSIYIPQFLDVYYFLNSPLDYSKLKSISHFRPIFLDKSLNIIEFGKSDKFIICQNDYQLIMKELDFLEKNFKYANKLYITKYYKNFLDKEQIVIDKLSELKPILKKRDFNLVYIIDFSYNEIIELFEELEKQPTLF